ncbi:hypothetical protein B0T14DRAFT_569419 [Immersiella caudata]|uniref:Uncharacterized protein n=1 Tax=Immersiella caudata TaxID=314043 RepID=A0AA39WDG1_9PEZI|nr:hypothetical protein B0T14DRAFT_569419 [Immersiella caudata]
MHIAHTVNDTVSLLFGYLYTIMIIKSRRPPEDSWRAGLPLMEQLPSSLEHPATFIAILQFTIWSLLGILHSLRSPRYWPECGLVAGAVSIATGAWYGVATMIDTIIITAYLSLVVAKAVEWASAWRTRPSGVVLPLSMQDA